MVLNLEMQPLKKTSICIKIVGMEMNINYLTDDCGNKIAVQIPFREWSELMNDYQRLKEYYVLKSKLKKSFREIEEIERGNKKPVSLSGFLNAGH